MSSLNRLTPAAISNTVEVSPALANLNFDFSLWKLEAPREFDGVGSSLSTIRRDDAENGTPHTTARKLGALFESILPSTPRVTTAYGQRASDISQASSVSPQTRSKYGVFSSQVGSDATSIWAAATSGPAAIAVHLLACILAKMWDGQEATVIWVEIVQRRKESILRETDVRNIAQMATLAAAKQDITRSQLREWDARARSWLLTADKIKNRQQKQLMLILDNIKGSVSKMSDTYESVLTAWQNSLTQMEGLIQGVSQTAINGDILLALSAWHLFPDMVVVVPCKTSVRQHDPIFSSGGVLTIGLEKPNLDQSGISWSLPLANLRHYSAPVPSSYSISSSERSRLSLTEFFQAFLGCFLWGWVDAALDTSRALRWLSYISDVLDDAASAGSPCAESIIGRGEFSWLSLLFSAAKYHLICKGNEKLVAKKLVSLGRRHGKGFLGLPRSPMFGLLNKGLFVGFIRTEDDQIHYLRKVAHDVYQELGLESHQVFIRYKHRCNGASKATYEYATALPWYRTSTKRKLDQSEHATGIHRRWLYAGSANLGKGRLSNETYYRRLDENFNPSFSGFHGKNHHHDDVPSDFTPWHEAHGSETSPYHSDREYFDHDELLLIQQDFERRKSAYAALGEETLKREDLSIEDFALDKMSIFWDQMGDLNVHPRQTPWFRFLYGDPRSAAIFILEETGGVFDLLHSAKQKSEDLFSLFEADKIEPNALIEQLAWHFQLAEPQADPYVQSTKAVSTAAMVYKSFPEATIDIRILECKLWQAHWVASAISQTRGFRDNLRPERGLLYAGRGTKLCRVRIQWTGNLRDHLCFDRATSTLYLFRHMTATPSSLEPYDLNQAAAFACVTMFETGRYNVNPAELGNVMAMSSGNSLFLGAALLRDPSQESLSGAIRRIDGNIGRPGIVFLVPPVDPLIKKVSITEWPQFGSVEFEGELKDCFKSTSLHLSFTSASAPVNVNVEFSGVQDADVCMLETLVSVHDSGRWIADLNILDTFRSLLLKFVPLCKRHHQDSEVKSLTHTKSIESWLELIDALDDDFCLVQTHRSWEARLAACSISVAKKYCTITVPDKICWTCLREQFDQFSVTIRPLIVIL